MTTQWLRQTGLAVAILVSGSAQAAESPDFERVIAPLLATNCLECHGQTDPQGGLDLTRGQRMLAGGDNGPAVVPGDPEGSYLLDRVTDGEMPPPKHEKPRPLAPADVAALRAWIEAGAAWPAGRVLDPYERTSKSHAGRDWWSLAPLQPAQPPAAKAGWRVANPLDAFVCAELDAQGMTQAPAAPPRVLIRRVYFDLTGLPPSPEEVAAFEADSSPDAYEKLVDRLLAAPQFGERWARYWLDLARFAETNGYERDGVKPHAWKYRDWVVQALNDDKPYDRFVLEQLAGDELPDRNESTVTGTGFLRLGTWDDEPNDLEEYVYERLEDMVHATSTAFLGLTIKCARCHDHKFDPIPQTDYYRVAAAFWPGPLRGNGPSKEQLGFDVLGWTDISRDPQPLHLLRKGELAHPGPAVPAGSPTVIAEIARDAEPPSSDAQTTQRRLQLARWIVDPRNPLTPRVAVNRLWQHHFGAALVRTPDNFGFLGERPTHVQLLDWLAARLIDGGWQMKPLHKLIVMSQTYRQASLHPQQADYERKDLENRLWWRAARQRLDAEGLRDAVLAVSGELDSRVGGESFRPPINDEALEGLSKKMAAYVASPPAECRRRSLYVFSQRSLQLPLLTAFDACDSTLPCGRRDVTTVAPQALALLNNEWVQNQSEAFARRILAAPLDTAGRIDLAWQIALSRPPDDGEVRAAIEHLEAQRKNFGGSADDPRTWSSLCHVLLNTNEFIYLD